MTGTKTATVGVVDSMDSSKIQPESNATTGKISPQDVKQSNCLVSALRPLLLSMSIMGLFDIWKFLEYGEGKPEGRRTVLKLYRIIVIILLGFNFTRYFLAYRSFDFGYELLSTIQIHAFFLQCLLISVICYKMVENPTVLIQFFMLWRKYWEMVKNDSENLNSEQVCSWRRIRRYASIGTVFGWCATIANAAFFLYVIFDSNNFRNILEPFPRSNGFFPLLAGAFLVVFFWASCAWSLILAFMIIVSLSLYYEFKQFVHRMKKMSQHATVSTAQKCLEVYRQQHNILCNMLDTGDEVLHHLIGSCLFIHILDCLLLIYNLCRYDGVGSDTGQLFSHIFWFFGMSTTLITVIAVCSLVNIRAHEPAKLIYNLSMEDFTAEFALQVNVFLHRLNGPPMGLTAWSLFVVDSQVVVSIAGIFATYFVVLLQFQQSVSTTTPAGLNITTV